MINDTEKIIIFAYNKWKFERFDKFELTVECWLKDNESFGLNGFKSKYPNSNKVFSSIMGTKIKNAFVSLGDNFYKLNENYLSEIKKIQFKLEGKSENNIETDNKLKDGLNENERQRLLRCLKSDAYKFFKSENLNEIALVDAYSFWELYPGADQAIFREKAQFFDNLISKTRKILESKDQIVLNNRSTNSGLVNKEIIFDIVETNNFISDKFNDEIKVIERRSKKDGRSKI